MRPHVYPKTMQMIVEDYALSADDRRVEADWWRASGQAFEVAIVRAARAQLENGKRHPHQRRLSAAVLERCAEALLLIADQLESVNRFHQLLTMIEDAYEGIRGAGELAAYDTADRLRHRLGLASEHIVYLHAGTRRGARLLAGGRLADHDGWGIVRHQVHPDLHVLSNHEIEDVLCSYRGALVLPPNEAAKWLEDRASACGRSGSRIC